MSIERGICRAEHFNKSPSLQTRISNLIGEGKTIVDPKDAFLKLVWIEVEEDYQKLADDLASACKEELNIRRIPAVVESRVKSRASITKSLERREIYRQTRKEEPYRDIREILQDLHDLVGIRIVVDYLDHMKLTSGFVTDTFHQEKDPNIFSANRKVGHSWTSWFGAYECTNHHVSAKYQDHNPLSYYNGVIFEIQVTSLPASLYNKIAHPLLYKEEAGELSQGDEIVIDLTKGLAFCYSLCIYYKRYKLDGKAVDTSDMDLLKGASSATEGPEFESSIDRLAGRIPGVDAAGIKGKVIPRETLDLVLGRLLNNELSREIGQCLVDKLRIEIQDVGRPRIELHAFGKARFDSQDVFQSPVCQEGTQTGAREYIHNWIKDGKERLLWICSHAGTGKSTLARTIARELTETGQIAAGYFFKRGDVGRNHIRHVIPTIAAQLILTIPQYEHYLRESIDACKNTDFENMLLFEQFKVLLKTPLLQVDHVPSTKIIIIDALDESVDLVQLEQVMDLLAGLKNCGLIRFRLLVTSRDEDPVRAAITRHPHEKLSLSTTYRSDTISDIDSISRVGFQKIRKDRGIEQTWPTKEQFREVVHRSTNPAPLFIYATTLLRFLGYGTRLGRPKKRLESWIDKRLGSTFTTQLDEMYTTVFENLDPDLGPGDSENLTEDEKGSLRVVLGAIALAAEPLSVNSLLAILGLDPDVLDLLNTCRAVLYIPEDNDEPVQMLHKSFSDFLLRQPPQRPCWFNVDERKQHGLLAQSCINHLEDKLRVNICQLQDPAVLRVDIQPSIIERYIPNSIQYASSCWVQHAQKSGDTDLLAGVVQSFLYKRFLEWTECMAILGRLERVSSAIQELRVNNRLDDCLGRFLYDAYRFLLKHGPIIQKTPRQTCGSALLFSPASSIIRITFWNQRLPGCQNSLNIPENWDSLLQQTHLLLGKSGVDRLALSSDGKRLAVSHHTLSSPGYSRIDFIDLWQPLTGTHLSRTRVPSEVVAMCWDKDGENVIFVARNGQVYTLNSLQEQPIMISSQPFRFGHHSLTAISSTGVLISSHSIDSELKWSRDSNNFQVSVWDAIDSKPLRVWMPMAELSAVAISHDSSHIAVISDGMVKLGNTKTWSFSELAKLSSDAFILRFSSDGNSLFIGDLLSVTMVSIHEDRSWTIEVPWNSSHNMVVFPDDKTFATDYNDSLLLWSIEHNAFRQHGISSNQGGTASPAISFYDATWEISLGINDFEGTGETTHMTMSPDGQYLVSIYNNRIHLRRLPYLKLHKALVHGEPVCFEFFLGPNDTLNFSRDGTAILASCGSVVYIWLLEEKESSEIELPPAAAISFRESYNNDPYGLYQPWYIKSIWLTGRKIAFLVLNRVEIWEIQDRARRLYTFVPPQKHSIGNIAFAPGSELLAIAYGSVVTVLSLDGHVLRQCMAMPLGIRALSFSPDGSMLLFLCELGPESDDDSSQSIEFDDLAPSDRAIWTAVVCDRADPCLRHPRFISMPVRCLLSATDVREAISSSSQFILHNDPHSSDFNATEFLFSTDGMSIKLRSPPSTHWYSVQHAKHLPLTSQNPSMVCEIDRPETQTWIRRGSQRVIQIPQGYARSCVGYGDRHVAMIDSRGEIVLLEFT